MGSGCVKFKGMGHSQAAIPNFPQHPPQPFTASISTQGQQYHYLFSEKPPIFPFLKETILCGNEAKGLLPLPHFPKATHSSDPSLTRTQKHLGVCVMGKTNKLEDGSL